MNKQIAEVLIFLVAGLLLILFPKAVLRFHRWGLKVLRIKKCNCTEKNTRVVGIVLIVIGILWWFIFV